MRRWRALAVRRQAELNLSHTLVTPPIDDEIGHPQLAQREFVQAGTIQLMSVVRTYRQRRDRKLQPRGAIQSQGWICPGNGPVPR